MRAIIPRRAFKPSRPGLDTIVCGFCGGVTHQGASDAGGPRSVLLRVIRTVEATTEYERYGADVSTWKAQAQVRYVAERLGLQAVEYGDTVVQAQAKGISFFEDFQATAVRVA